LVKGRAAHAVGLGDANYRLAFCVANRPALNHYPTLDCMMPLAPGELTHIVANSSNHWRKLFSVYAKFLYQLDAQPGWPTRWQDYRDQYLLQAGSGVALLFSEPDTNHKAVHIIAGKTYAAELGLKGLTWLDSHFAISPERRLLVSPYLDYRQLSNEKIAMLTALIHRYQLLGNGD
tara:strand:- start:236 stop:763 length:528 start_codon:yes stop_codon:yes gene_type:complete